MKYTETRKSSGADRKIVKHTQCAEKHTKNIN